LHPLIAECTQMSKCAVTSAAHTFLHEPHPRSIEPVHAPTLNQTHTQNERVAWRLEVHHDLRDIRPIRSRTPVRRRPRGRRRRACANHAPTRGRSG
jgi:hypothetical protein